jgi:hypothetical protein
MSGFYKEAVFARGGGRMSAPHAVKNSLVGP